MGSIFYDGKLLMRPDEENNNSYDFDFGYPHEVPKVYLYSCGEDYFPHCSFFLSFAQVAHSLLIQLTFIIQELITS